MNRRMLILVESIIFSSLLLCASLLPGVTSSNVVTLESIQIFINHNFLPFKPVIYFRCQGAKVIILPDVKDINHVYTFKGEESWQPLTELPDDKCKRCGLYQRGVFKPDDTFDEWELCLNNFVNGTYTYFKENQFNATFRCPVNQTSGYSSNPVSNSKDIHKHRSVAMVITISIVVSAIVAIGLIAGFKYWQKRKREQDQARFLKMFEEGDDIEDELGLDTL